MEKKRVCAYARVSTEFEEQMGSYDNQVEVYTEMIKSNPEWEFVGIYADPGLSGTMEERPEFQRMLKDAEKHRIDIILVKSISRFARNTLLFIETIRHLQDLGVAVIFEKEKIDTSKPYSEMMLTILSAFAQEESRNISERTRKGLMMKAMNGEAAWSPVYGYRKEGDKAYVIVEEEAAIVRRIFDEYEKGKSSTAIAEILNREGFFPPVAKTWIPSSITYIVDNERYVGDILTNKEITESHLTHKRIRNNGTVEQVLLDGHHEGIVSREQYDRVTLIRTLKKTNQYPFDKHLLCPYCGKPLQKKAIKRRSYWCCEEDRFYQRPGNVTEALLKAYAKLDTDGVTDEKTVKIKEENPEMFSVEYWWVDDLVEKITFGKHLGCGDLTMTVHWICGKETTVSSGARTVFTTRKRIEGIEEKTNPKKGKTKVVHIARVVKAATGS